MSRDFRPGLKRDQQPEETIVEQSPDWVESQKMLEVPVVTETPTAPFYEYTPPANK
jgi:hypothetical protein